MSALFVTLSSDLDAVDHEYVVDNLYWCDLFFGVKTQGRPVDIQGCIITCSWHDGSYSWPPAGVVVQSTDQDYLTSCTVYSPPGDGFGVDVSFYLNGNIVRKSILLERPLPPKPNEHSLWDHETFSWVFPKPFPPLPNIAVLGE